MLVDMERSYITAGFFRYTMHRRYATMQQQAVLQQALDKGPPPGGKGSGKKGLTGYFGAVGGGERVGGGCQPRWQERGTGSSGGASSTSD
jgi:hypothetical protein